MAVTAWEAFLEWARELRRPGVPGEEPRRLMRQWLAGVAAQPVLRLDSALSREELVAAVLDWEPPSDRN